MKKILLSAVATLSLATTTMAQNFTDATSSTNLATNMDYWSIEAYDFNNDNKVDLIYKLTSSNFYQFFKNNGNGTFNNVTSSMGLSIDKNYTLKFCDFNKDGLTDIIAGKDSSTFTKINLFKQSSPNAFIDVSVATNIPGLITGSFQDVMDYDVDGDIDIIYATKTTGDKSLKAIKARILNQNVYFDTLSTIINVSTFLTSSEIPQFTATFDYDNDNDGDILYCRFCTNCGLQSNGNFNAHQYGILRNDGNGIYTENTINTNIGRFPRKPFAWDYNNDGIFDLISGNTDNLPGGQGVTGSKIIVKKGNSNGTYTDVTTTTQLYDGVQRYYRVDDISDFNNDFTQDVLTEIDGGSNANYKLYQNTNGISFSDVASTNGINLNTSFTNGGHVWMDYDNDGDLDLFANNNGTLKVLKNNITSNNWIKLRLYGCATNADAYGVKIMIKANGKKIALSPTQGSLRMRSDLHIGLGSASVIDSISVYWLNSNPLQLTNVSPNQYLNIYENQNGNCYSCTNVTTVINNINVINYDTTYVTVTDTNFVNQTIYDTTFVTITDTNYVNQTIYDTTYVTVTDTNYVTVYDTVTTYISVTDTLFINVNTVGLNNNTIVNTIKVFPNPANSFLNLDYGNYINLNGYSVKIVNALSQVIYNQPITQQSETIDLSTFGGNGIYYLNILNPQGNVVEVRKIVLQ